MTAPASKPFWVACPDCDHQWIAAYFPQRIEDFVARTLEHSDCPRCGTPAIVARTPGLAFEDAGPEAPRSTASSHAPEPRPKR